MTAEQAELEVMIKQVVASDQQSKKNDSLSVGAAV